MSLIVRDDLITQIIKDKGQNSFESLGKFYNHSSCFSLKNHVIKDVNETLS